MDTKRFRLYLFGLATTLSALTAGVFGWSYAVSGDTAPLWTALAFAAVGVPSAWRFANALRLPDDGLRAIEPKPGANPATRTRRAWLRGLWIAASATGVLLLAPRVPDALSDGTASGLLLVVGAALCVAFGTGAAIELIRTRRESA